MFRANDQEKDEIMAKRQSRATQAKVEPLFGGTWQPPGEAEREQSYVRNVRPQGEHQRALLAAIQRHALT
ncbi:MAG: hypothetical protein ACREFQ_19265, partial [Stellaceae bacterium]